MIYCIWTKDAWAFRNVKTVGCLGKASFFVRTESSRHITSDILRPVCMACVSKVIGYTSLLEMTDDLVAEYAVQEVMLH